jgi:hypothetical protein
MVEAAPFGVPELREGRVDERLEHAVAHTPFIEASTDTILIRVPAVGRFLVRARGPVLVERCAGATDDDLRCFRDEPVAAAAALLRGALALRASSVAIGGRAVVVCGPSAAGKSALAAGIAQRGHRVLADAVTVLSTDPTAPVTVTPLAAEPALWPDSAEELGLSGAPSRLVRPALPKRAFALGRGTGPAPVAAVLWLRASAIPSPQASPLAGTVKLQSLLAARWHGLLAAALDLEQPHFTTAARLAAAVPCFNLERPRVGMPVAELAQLVEELVA